MDFILVSNLLSLILFLAVYLYIYKTAPTLIFVFFYLFFGYFSVVCSVFYLDLGGKYSFELLKKSTQSNSLIVLTIFYLSTLALFLFWYRLRVVTLKQSLALNFKKRMVYLTPRFIHFFLFITAIYIFILYLHMIYTGVPLFLSYGKGEIWEYSKFKFLQPINNQASTILLVLGFLYSYILHYKNYRAFTKYLFYFKLMLFVFVCYIILMGYKFGGPLLYIFSFYVSYLVFFSINNRLRFRDLMKYISLSIIFFIPIVWYVYSNASFLSGDVWSLIFDRIFTLQGQIWHFLYTGIVDHSISTDFSQLFKEFKNLFSDTYSSETGINYVMSLIMPENRLASYIDQGIRLSGGYPAILVSISGFSIITFFFHVLFSSLICMLHFAWLSNLLKLNLIRFILWFKLAFVSKNIIFMGDIHVLFSLENMIYLFIIFGVYLFRWSLINQKKKLISRV